YTTKLIQVAVAVNDTYSTPNDAMLNTTVQNGVLANDQFTFGGDVVLVQGASKGQLMLATDGSFSYRADAGASGMDWFTYRIVKEGMSSNVGTVTLNLVATVRLNTLTLTRTTVVGGQSSTGTVTLQNAAPAGGAEVSLVSGSSAIRVPATVVVPEGATSANFGITTAPVASTAVRTVTASRGGVSKTASLTLLAGLTGFTVSSTNAVGGSTLTGTVNLGSAAPAGGVSVSIVENTSVFETPTSVNVPAGASSATFNIATTRVGAPVTRPISASYGGVTKIVNITLNPGAVLTGLTLSKTTVKGGEALTATVTLDRAAPAGGVTVTLTSGSSAIIVPTNVVVPEGASSATFNVTTARVGITATRSISASYLGVTRSAALTLTP
ncbi:MAG TPA: Ig-like domain-containing protein, partial [Fimbriimonadaceae bacterium]|nr:Ig-like domain-containing protein [Fimbriimonadaceae bacterium]